MMGKASPAAAVRVDPNGCVAVPRVRRENTGGVRHQ